MKKIAQRCADTAIVLDFETTGLSADNGDRAIEIGAIRIEQGKITDRFQSLMNPGMRVDPFIESYTGITNAMLRDAPPCKEVMSKFADFIEDYDLVAHNASFDSRFLTAELHRVKRLCAGEFACTMLVARRLYQDATNHKLGTLVKLLRLPNNGTFHRALADADMTAHLWLNMLTDIKDKYHIREITFPLMQKISRTAKPAVPRFLRDWNASNTD